MDVFLIAVPVHHHRERRAVKVDRKTSLISPYISDMYGCLSFWGQSFSSLLHVYVKDILEGDEKLVDAHYISDKQWDNMHIRLQSFTRGPYKVNILTYRLVWSAYIRHRLWNVYVTFVRDVHKRGREVTSLHISYIGMFHWTWHGFEH